MNLILLQPEEVAKEITLSGRRAAHLLGVLKVEPGGRVRVGVVDGPKGFGEVLETDAETVRLRLELGAETPPRPPLVLILALPRPIMLQRILKQATVMGMAALHLIKSAKVEKSYFASPVLEADRMRALLSEGLEQAMDTRLPEVHVHRRFRPFVEDALPQIPGRGLIAHPGAASGLAEVFTPPTPERPTLLAVGPEGGWNDFEIDAFVRAGFTPFGMGPRILHVDTAVVALTAQIDLLRTGGLHKRRETW